MKSKIGVHTVGNAETLIASTLRVYIPHELRSACNLEVGDTFEYRVVNNKIALRYSPTGELSLSNGYFISVRASIFEPPLRVRKTEHVMATLANDWLVFQVPEVFEHAPKGFQLYTDE